VLFRTGEKYWASWTERAPLVSKLFGVMQSMRNADISGTPRQLPGNCPKDTQPNKAFPTVEGSPTHSSSLFVDVRIGICHIVLIRNAGCLLTLGVSPVIPIMLASTGNHADLLNINIQCDFSHG